MRAQRERVHHPGKSVERETDPAVSDVGGTSVGTLAGCRPSWSTFKRACSAMRLRDERDRR